MHCPVGSRRRRLLRGWRDHVVHRLRGRGHRRRQDLADQPDGHEGDRDADGRFCEVRDERLLGGRRVLAIELLHLGLLGALLIFSPLRLLSRRSSNNCRLKRNHLQLSLRVISQDTSDNRHLRLLLRLVGAALADGVADARDQRDTDDTDTDLLGGGQGGRDVAIELLHGMLLGGDVMFSPLYSL